MQTYESGNHMRICVVSAGQRYEFYAVEIFEVVSRIAELANKVIGFIADNLKAISILFEDANPSVIEFLENIKAYQEKETEREYKRELHKLDFTRKKLLHQVMCRKPKRLVKKIIR